MHANIIKTGERTYCIIAEWSDMDALAAARPQMIATLDSFRDTLEDLGAVEVLQQAGGNGARRNAALRCFCSRPDGARSIIPIASVQNEYNLRNKNSEDVLSICERLGIAFLPWYPLGGRRGLMAKRVKEVASRRGLTHAALSLAWLLAKSPVVLPIPGTQSIDHLEDNVNAAALKLEPHDFDALR